jgi:hypothetical protein
MRMVTEDLVQLENARFGAQAQGWFSAQSTCPSCGEERQVTFPICEQGQEYAVAMNCNNGHTWTAKARIVR